MGRKASAVKGAPPIVRFSPRLIVEGTQTQTGEVLDYDHTLCDSLAVQ